MLPFDGADAVRVRLPFGLRLGIAALRVQTLAPLVFEPSARNDALGGFHCFQKS